MQAKLKTCEELLSRFIRDLRSKQNHNTKQVESQLIERCPIFVEILNTLETVDTVALDTVGEVKNVVELFCDYIGDVLQTGEVGKRKNRQETLLLLFIKIMIM